MESNDLLSPMNPVKHRFENTNIKMLIETQTQLCNILKGNQSSFQLF